MLYALERLYLEQNGWCLVKRAFDTAGAGNEILLPDAPPDAISAGAIDARQVARTSDALRQYIAERWDWASHGSRDAVIVERFIPNARSVYVETEITDDTTTVSGTGEMFYNPAPEYQRTPLDVSDDISRELLAGAHRLSAVLKALGYRGHASCDALVLPDSSVLFTEINAQTTGSTHIHEGIATRLVTKHTKEPRLVIEHVWKPEWHVASFGAMRKILDASGLAYDEGSATGVLLTRPHDSRRTAVPYCIVSKDLKTNEEMQASLTHLLTSPSESS
jgi:hypothetical protein